jgi:hypothetical protein
LILLLTFAPAVLLACSSFLPSIVFLGFFTPSAFPSLVSAVLEVSKDLVLSDFGGAVVAVFEVDALIELWTGSSPGFVSGLSFFYFSSISHP